MNKSNEARKRLDKIKDETPLLGLAELADLLGFSRQNTSNWVARGKLPPEDFLLRATRCWWAKTIDKWLRSDPL